MSVRPTPEWLQAQYDNRARVTNSAVLLDRWARASALAREHLSSRLDLAYGSDPAETLDIFLTNTAEPAPVLVFLHGGYWRALDKSDHSFLAPVFTDEGAIVVVPNYSLCPSVTMDRIPLQMTQALAWVWRHIADFGGDPNRIIVVGHSAGGQLACLMLGCDWKSISVELPRHLVKGALSLSGLHDLTPLPRVPFLQQDLRLDEATARRLSPVRIESPEPPLYAVVGGLESEEFLRQTQAIRAAWGARAVSVCEVLPGFDHFTVLHDLADAEGRSHQLARRLLDLRWYSALM
ncbi:alpha/beta hydrolase [Roseateles amylovorans]|uniref:Carboxylic ester hydrolase n=1 Tax=Roseateles amylovorans TaxID=2978473 RepID=A0ABY6ATC9_9BURK|nr:alpha/beta hydrolase [Roseateles amylovorans]UXH76486.1 alpha/beta hydrolase [Roseateles amylovorans]